MNNTKLINTCIGTKLNNIKGEVVLKASCKGEVTAG